MGAIYVNTLVFRHVGEGIWQKMIALNLNIDTILLNVISVDYVSRPRKGLKKL
jgi:hypothetical protein